MIELVLKPGRDKSVRRRHPWVLSGSVASETGGEPGDWARVSASNGEVLAFGHYSPHSSLRVRLLSFGEQAPGDDLVATRIADAVGRRRSQPLLSGTDALRVMSRTAVEELLAAGLTMEEIGELLHDMRDNQIEMLTVGQYLRPSKDHHEVMKFYHPDEFLEIEEAAEALGFKQVAAGPFVRSSYHGTQTLPHRLHFLKRLLQEFVVLFEEYKFLLHCVH